jgi:hypothetical protein
MCSKFQNGRYVEECRDDDDDDDDDDDKVMTMTISREFRSYKMT